MNSPYIWPLKSYRSHFFDQYSPHRMVAMKPIVILTGEDDTVPSEARYSKFSPVLAETHVRNALAGKTLAEATIPRETGCSVVALYGCDNQPNPTTNLNQDTDIILIGTPESEQCFLKVYGAQTISAQPVAPLGLPA